MDILKSTDVFCSSDLPDNLVLCRDNSHTFYHASSSLELTRGIAACLSMLSTPDRVQRGTRSLGPISPTCWNSRPPMTSTRSFVTPSTQPLSVANMQFVFSPSPLPVSQVPSLVFPEISPPSQRSGSTPFERQFAGDFSQDWIDINTHISPVARRNPHSEFFSPASSFIGRSPSRTGYDPTSQDSLGRVSLIERFISAAADEFATDENDTRLSTPLHQNPSSPLSDLSDLTPLSSPESSGRSMRGLASRSSSPPTSPTDERHRRPRKSNTRCIPDTGQEPLSPATALSRSCDSDYLPAKGTAGCERKRASRSHDDDDEIPRIRKRIRIRTAKPPEPTSIETSTSLGTSNRRRLPTDIPHYPQFSLLYLRFPVSSYLRLADGTFPLLSTNSKRLAGSYNEPRDALDLYTPRFVKGCGATKVGACPICIESPSRGGKGEAVWLSMKFSAYKWHVSDSAYPLAAHFISLTESYLFIGKNTEPTLHSYHLQYAHGISSVSTRPFSPPTAFRVIERQNPAKNERASIQEGKCHKCKKWILVESIKNLDIKVKELYWWKHAAACHKGNQMEGDDDFFLDDGIYRRIQQFL